MDRDDNKQMELNDAIDVLVRSSKFIGRSVSLPIWDCVGRVILEELVCEKPLPSFDNSAMDGYGVRMSDRNKTATVVQAVMAGDEHQKLILKDGEIIKIMTGAIVDEQIDAVVPFENASINSDGTISLPDFKSGANIRRCGEEIDVGTVVIPKGTLLTPSHIGQLASQGRFVVKVSDKIRVAVLSSGNEIVEPWCQAKEHQIFNSNASTLMALCKEQNCEVQYIKVIGDSYESTLDMISSIKGYDVLLTSGGISMGEADFVGRALIECGLDIVFKKVNIKPGKPTMFGYMGSTAVLALPGNPLSAIVNFYLFALPLFAQLKGSNVSYHSFVEAINKGEFKIKSARANIVLGRLENGYFTVYNKYQYSSGMMSPIANSNAFIVAGDGVNSVADGQKIRAVMLNCTLTNKFDSFSI